MTTETELLDDYQIVVNADDPNDRGTVISTSRRCQMEGCRGIRLGVRWSNGKITYPCTRGLQATKTPGTWSVR